MSRKNLWMLMSMLLVASMILGACGSPTPETITVTKEVIVTKEVQVPGENTTVVVTATPEPVKAVEFVAKDPTTLMDVQIGESTDTLDPAWNYESAGDAIILNVYDQLITYKGGSALEFVPNLATEWKVENDGKTYVFTIRKGVKFHDGADLTAEDVAYTFRRGLLQGGTASPQWLYTEPLLGAGIYDVAELVDPAGSMTDSIDELKKADAAKLKAACETVEKAIVFDDAAGTVTFNLVQSWGPFLATVAGSWGSILDKDWTIKQGAWDGSCDTWQNFYGVTSETTPLRDKMNGTGGYMLDTWTPGQEMILKMNPNWWRTEPTFEGGLVKPTIERVVVKGVPEWGTRFAMLQAGDADVADVPRENVTQVDSMVGERCDYQMETETFTCKPTENPDAPLRLHIGMPSAVRTDAFFVFNINTTGGNPYIGSGQLDGNGIPADFFSDIHVRKAFNYCFDWDAYIQDALAGEAVQSVGFLIPGMIGYDQNGPKYSYDKAKCEEELKLAWDGQVAEKGFRMQIGYNTGNVTRQTIAQILQANLADVDPKYQLEIIGLPWPSFLAGTRESRIPIFISGWQEDLHDPHNWAQPELVGTYASRQKMPKEMLEEFNKLVTEGVGAPTDEQRAEIYKQLTQMDYDNAISIRLAVATGRRYEQRWMGSYYYNPIHTWNSRYYTITKK